MFIVTAHLVKPVNRDDLPQMRGIDGLKNGSPLGLEPKGEEIQGQDWLLRNRPEYRRSTGSNAKGQLTREG